MAVIVDSYSESNQNSFQEVYGNGSGFSFAYGQTFSGSDGTLNSAKFYLEKVNSPTGNVYAKIYNITGTSGVNGAPSGPAIATSDAVDVSTFGTSFGLITFTFSGVNKITLNTGTNYCVVFYYQGIGDQTNTMRIGIKFPSPTDDGNPFFSSDGSNWTTDTSFDICFYVYKDNLSVFTVNYQGGVASGVKVTQI